MNYVEKSAVRALHDVGLTAHLLVQLRCYPIVKGEGRIGEQIIAASER
jgi:hypothetical protein